MRVSIRLGGLTLLVLAGVFGASGSASAGGVDVGIRGGFYTDVDKPFIGAELLFGVSDRIYFNPNVEYVFIENGSYLTVNGDFHYDFLPHGPTYFWMGAGLGLARIDPDGPDNSDSELVGNFLAGVGFKAGGSVPYIQGKIIVKDDTAASLAVGIRF